MSSRDGPSGSFLISCRIRTLRILSQQRGCSYLIPPPVFGSTKLRFVLHVEPPALGGVSDE